MIPATSVVERAGEQLGDFLPRLAGALLILVVGVVLARLAARLVTRLLRTAGTDELAERLRVSDTLEQIGLGRALSPVVGTAVRLLLLAVFVFAALSLLGLAFLQQALNEAVLFLPRILVAAALLLAGVVLSGFARERVDRAVTQLDLAVPLGTLAGGLVLGVFAATAAAQIGVPTTIIVGLLALVAAAAALTLALAFGLGGRDAARGLSAGRYVREALAVGQTISVAGVRGRITAIEGTTTVLDPGDGTTVRVPNGRLLDEVVVVEAAPGEPG